MFIFLLKGQKKNEPKRKNLFNVSLTLHWANLYSPSINTNSTMAWNVWNLARAF